MTGPTSPPLGPWRWVGPVSLVGSTVALWAGALLSLWVIAGLIGADCSDMADCKDLARAREIATLLGVLLVAAATLLSYVAASGWVRR